MKRQGSGRAPRGWREILTDCLRELKLAADNSGVCVGSGYEGSYKWDPVEGDLVEPGMGAAFARFKGRTCREVWSAEQGESGKVSVEPMRSPQTQGRQRGATPPLPTGTDPLGEAAMINPKCLLCSAVVTRWMQPWAIHHPAGDCPAMPWLRSERPK